MEKAHTFSIREALSVGWSLYKKNVKTIILALIGIIVIVTAISIVLPLTFGALGAGMVGNIITLVLIFLAGFLFQAGILRMYLNIKREEPTTYRDFMMWDLLIPIILFVILTTLAISVGLILFIIPGILLIVAWQFAFYALIDGHSVIGSLRESARITKGYRWKLLGFIVVMIIILLALQGIGALLSSRGIIGAILGFIVSIASGVIAQPALTLAHAHLYEKLRKEVGDDPEVENYMDTESEPVIMASPRNSDESEEIEKE